MRILVVGGGGREHALVWKILQSELVRKVFCAPGNPGTARIAENVAIPAEAVDELAAWAVSNRIDLVVVGPEGPLVAGLADKLVAAGVTVFGPSAAAARLEGS
jgi:phosphoribosylamine--glycine ligase